MDLFAQSCTENAKKPKLEHCTSYRIFGFVNSLLSNHTDHLRVHSSY